MFFIRTSILPPSKHQKVAKHGRHSMQNNKLLKRSCVLKITRLSRKPEYNADVLVKRFIYSDKTDPLGSEVRQYLIDMTS